MKKICVGQFKYCEYKEGQKISGTSKVATVAYTSSSDSVSGTNEWCRLIKENKMLGVEFDVMLVPRRG